MSMNVLTALAGGFLDRKDHYEKIQRDQAADAQRREGLIFQHLLGSDDPEIQSLALTGLLDTANPRRKSAGFRGWIGETDASPYLQQVQQLIATPVVEQRRTLPSRQAVGASSLATPPPPQGAAMSQSSPVQPGGPTQEPPQMNTPPPQVPQLGGMQMQQSPPQPYAVERARRVFLTGADKIKADSIAREQGEIEGMRAGYLAAGFSEDETQELLRAAVVRRNAAGVSGYAEGTTIADDKSPTGYSQILYSRNNPREQIRIPAPAPAVRAFGTERNAAILALFPGRDPQSLTTQEWTQVEDRVKQTIGAQAYERGIQTGTAANQTKMDAPLTPEQSAQQDVPFGTTMAQLAGIVPITPEQRERADAAKALSPQITDIEALVRKVFPPQSRLVGAMKASEVIGAKRLARDPDLAALEGQLARAQGNIARVLAAESGRLTQQDVERASKSLADISGWTDTQESALARLQDVYKAVRNITADLQTAGDQLRARQAAEVQGPPVPADVSTPTTTPTTTTPAPAAGAPATGAPQVGQSRLVQGQWMTITAVYPDGTFDADPMSPTGFSPAAIRPMTSRPVATPPPAPVR